MRLGPREAEMLMDGLLSLEADWQDSEPPPSAADQDRLHRLLLKLRKLQRERGWL